MIYTVALVKNSGYLQTVRFHENREYEEKYPCDTVTQTNKDRRKNTLEEFGNCKVVFYLQTSDTKAYLNANIKCLEEELKDLVSQQNETLKKLEDDYETQSETAKMYMDTQMTFMRNIGRAVRRLMNRDSEGVYEFSELAKMCYDVFQSEIQAKRDKDRFLHTLNRRYYNSLVSPYC